MIEFGTVLHQPKAAENSETRVAIYARTSSVNQRYGYSLDEQVRLCFKRCQLLEWDVLFVFRDEAESGKDTERPMFQSLMTEAERGQFDVVVFWKLDRLSRSLLHAVQIESDLREFDVALHSVTEQIDTTTSAGRFNFRNLASAAEFERDMIKERSTMGLKALAAEGKWPNDSPPIGYQVVEDGRLEIVEKEAKFVQKVFQKYLSLKSMPQVAHELNQQEGEVGDERDWTARGVRDILKNGLYTGKYSVAGVEKQVDAYKIIEDAIFDRATELRHRFHSQSEARESMPGDRKARLVKNIGDQYHSFYRQGS